MYWGGGGVGEGRGRVGEGRPGTKHHCASMCVNEKQCRVPTTRLGRVEIIEQVKYNYGKQDNQILR